MNCPKCKCEMDTEFGCLVVAHQHTVTVGIPYADYYCEECDNYYQWIYGVPGLRNVSKGEQFPEDWENKLYKKINQDVPISWQAWEQYEKDFDIDWNLIDDGV